MYCSINASDLTIIGKLTKTHGINGEITLQFADGIDVDLEMLKCVFIDIDGIFVPFFIESTRPKGATTDIVKFDGIDDEQRALSLCGDTIYALRSEIISDPDSGMFAADLIGYAVVADNSKIGTIVDIDDTTINCLFIVEAPDGKRILIPAVDEFVAGLDPDQRELTLNLPEGLIEI